MFREVECVGFLEIGEESEFIKNVKNRVKCIKSRLDLTKSKFIN